MNEVGDQVVSFLDLMVAVIALVVAGCSLFVASRSVSAANRSASSADKSASASEASATAARRANEQDRLFKLFNAFEVANKVTIQNPKLLYSVHGIDPDTEISEAQAIAYMSLLMDAFQNYYGSTEQGGTHSFEKMASEHTFLNRIFCVESNQNRWNVVKEKYFGDFDVDFVDAVEKVVKRERASHK